MIHRFSQANPDIEVTLRVKNQEEYKSGFDRMLETEDVDLAFWFAGARLRESAARGQLKAIQSVRLQAALSAGFDAAAVGASRIAGMQVAVPLSYYGWGIYYKKSLFARLGLKPPTTWAELLLVGDRLKVAGIDVTAIGGQDGWPAAAWFDYLNLRINGIEFHRKVLAGEVKFSHPRVREVFVRWKELLDRGFFMPALTPQAWDAPLPYFYRGRVGMLLMGGFATAKFPKEMAPDIGFTPFVQITPGVARAEDAPLDVLVLPKRGRNTAAVERFVAFLATSDALNRYNERLNRFSPLKTFAPQSELSKRELESLRDASAISFFFDRDVAPNRVQPGLAAFKSFLIPPFDIDAALRALDAPVVANPAP